MNAYFRKSLGLPVRLPVRLSLRLTSAVAASLAALLVAPAMAAPRTVEAFDAGTWPTLQSTLKAPAVVVFSTTDCAHCPAVIEQLSRGIVQRKLKASLLVVVMDAVPGEADADLLQNPHFQPAHRLLAFDGQAPALRHAVNPRWRGVTPYVVFLAPKQPAVAVTGPPDRHDIDAWARLAAGQAGQAGQAGHSGPTGHAASSASH